MEGLFIFLDIGDDTRGEPVARPSRGGWQSLAIWLGSGQPPADPYRYLEQADRAQRRQGG
jgi:hypothetical protein